MFMSMLSSQAERSDDNESNMMGDKLTQKMDSVMFAQERLKRQVDQLEDSVKVRMLPVDGIGLHWIAWF